MENIIYNELLRRGYSVDVGVVCDRTGDSKVQKEIDFVVNDADKKSIFSPLSAWIPLKKNPPSWHR